MTPHPRYGVCLLASLASVVFALASVVFALPVLAQEVAQGTGKLTHVQSVPREDLKSVNHVNLSADGKFVYTSSWEAMAVNVFSRNEKTGQVEHVQTVTSPRDLDGLTSLVLSPDGKFAAGSAFRSQTAVLFARDAQTGQLRQLDSARNAEKGVKGLVWAIDLEYSTDGKFLYVLDPHGPGDNAALNQGVMTVFEITENERLRWVEANPGQENCFHGARGVAAHPKGKWLYIASSEASCVVMAERDAESGKAAVRQIIRDGEGQASALNGAMTPLVTPDGKFLYVNSGRFSGDSGVTAFTIGEDGLLKFLEEHLGETGEVKNYAGGNTLAVTPDGRNLYAVATRSGTLACFARDPETGKLTYQETLADDTGRGELGGAAGVAVSPDGRFVYVAAEFDNALTVYQRN
jgi:6-phosphogluconolactonase (cycloisomerase 2 family)